MQKYADNCEIIISLENSKILNKMWNISYLENELRTFIFKLHNNTQEYNLVLSKFKPNVEPFCTFCLLARDPDPEHENALHLFFNCPHVEPVLNDIHYFVTGNPDEIRRTNFFGVPTFINTANQKIVLIVNAVAKKFIWDCKLRKCLPSNDTFRSRLIAKLQTYANINSNFRDTVSLSNLPIIRHIWE